MKQTTVGSRFAAIDFQARVDQMMAACSRILAPVMKWFVRSPEKPDGRWTK
jgi:hypothetical protein